MNFEFSRDQQFLRDQASKQLAETCPLSEVHRLLNNEEYFSEPVWSAMIESGWTATALPEEYGGFGMGYLELCVLAEELGRVSAPVPFSSAVYLAAEALLIAGSDEQKARYLPKLASGECFGTLAMVEEAGPFMPEKIQCSVANGRISGRKIAVPDGQAADYVIVAVKDVEGLSLCIASLKDVGVDRKASRTIDSSRSYSQIEFLEVSVEPLGDAGKGEIFLAAILDRAAVLMAFEQLGGAGAVLEMGRQYASERHAFGRAIGSFQAIKHKLANMYVQLELARSNCYHGAYALATNVDELPIAAAVSRLSAGRAFNDGARDMTHIHGGMGFTWEGDCQLFYRRARLLGLALGSERSWKETLMQRILAARAAGSGAASARPIAVHEGSHGL